MHHMYVIYHRFFILLIASLFPCLFRSYEQAGLIAKENKDVESCVNLLTKAARLFQENGTPDTAALTLEKAAKYVITEFYF